MVAIRKCIYVKNIFVANNLCAYVRKDIQIFATKLIPKFFCVSNQSYRKLNYFFKKSYHMGFGEMIEYSQFEFIIRIEINTISE